MNKLFFSILNKLSFIKENNFIRFGIVGVIATIIHYGIYFLLLELNFNATISYSIGYLLSLIINFYLTFTYTFKTKVTLNKGLGFASSHIINYFLHIFFLNLYLYLGFSKTIAPLPVYATVVPINFLLLRYFLKK